MYRCRQREEDRSTVNVCFELREPALLPLLLAEAEQAGLHHLAGHAAVGSLRASLYNAMPLAGVERLVAFLQHFEREHG